MRLNSVAVLGGGPGGLYTARLLKRRMPDCEVRVLEQSEPAHTFGFGVGLATRTQRNLQAADAESFDAIIGIAHGHVMSMVVDAHTVTLPSDNLIAVSRAQLLDVLRTKAREAGVLLEYGARGAAADLARDVDLVVAADGVSSATRDGDPAFGGSVTTADGLYLWAGTDVALPSALFAPVTTDHGTFVAHAYPYAADRSTFLIETDEETWRRAGFDVTTDETPYDRDDQVALDYLGDAFAEHLRGHRLIGNRTRWLRFRTVTCQRWSHDNVVLLGDAVHTAHYSIGSGTKLAMEDGIALVDALASADDLDTALSDYEAVRRPAAAHLQETALRSMRWWDSFATRLDLSVERLWVAYMTRAGKVSLDRFAASASEVVRTAVASWSGCSVTAVPTRDISDWVIAHQPDAPEDATPVLVDVDDPWGSDADDLVKSVDHGPVLLQSAPVRSAVLTMLDLGERIRREVGATVLATLPTSERDLAGAALISGRADVVVMR